MAPYSFGRFAKTANYLWKNRNLSKTMLWAGKGASRFSRSRAGRAMLTGAIGGGMYGTLDNLYGDRVSVVGGIMKGAMWAGIGVGVQAGVSRLGGLRGRPGMLRRR